MNDNTLFSTPELRWIEKYYNCEWSDLILQQKFVDSNGNSVWKEVPTINEDDE